MENYYALLELNIEASQSEIKEKIKSELSRWRKRVNAPDPQRQREASERMELLQKAEEILLDSVKRKEYDIALQQSFQQQTFEQQVQGFGGQSNEQQPSLAEQLIDEANNLIERNNIADAIVAAKRATEADGNNPYGWSILARAHILWGEINDAIYEINRAISLLPNDPHFYYVLYHCQMERKDMPFEQKLNEAEIALNKALSIDAGNPDYLMEAAFIASKRGQTDYGIKILKEVEAKHGLHQNAQNLLAELYYDKGISLTQRVDYNDGNSLYYFTSQQAAQQAKDYFTKASYYVQNQNFRREVQKWIGVANDAFKVRNNYKILALYLLIVPLFLQALGNFNLIMMLFLAGAGYLVWKKGRVPQYELNRKYINTLR